MNISKLHEAIKMVCPIHGVDENGKISFKDEATETERAAAQSIVDNWVDVPGKKWTPFEFAKRFTLTERIAIEQSTDVYVKDFWMMATAAQEIVSDNTDTISGMAYLVSVSLLTETRKNEILT